MGESSLSSGDNGTFCLASRATSYFIKNTIKKKKKINVTNTIVIPFNKITMNKESKDQSIISTTMDNLSGLCMTFLKIKCYFMIEIKDQLSYSSFALRWD